MATKRIAFAGALAGVLLIPGLAQATLTATPLTWNVIGLDSNAPAAGPNHFPVGARVCSSVGTTNVDVKLVWDSANANVNLRPGSLGTITIPSIAAGACADAYFEVEVTKVAAAYDTTRRYHIAATDPSGTASTPTPRELYVEHLISQNRNAITGIKLDGTPIPAGGAMTLVVGNTYTIELDGGTATQGYNQFEAFINFPNTIFQIVSVSTTYSADNSPWVPGPFPLASDKLYADACLWDNDPASPNYRSCLGGDYKAGGSDVRTAYTVKIIGGGGTAQTLSGLLYDFSGSSHHYNSDFSVNTWIADIVDPASVTIAKAFSPTPTVAGGTSTLTFTLTNPNSGAVGGASFTDTLPLLAGGQMVVATPAVYSTAGCGAPTFAPLGGATSISFSNGTIAANSSCVVSVKVSVPSLPTSGSYANVSGNLFIGAADTGHNATASLGLTTVAPPANSCGLILAQWSMPPAAGSGVPPAYSLKAADVTSAAAVSGAGISGSFIEAVIGNPANSWATRGYSTAATLNTVNNDYIEFSATTTNYTNIAFSFDARRDAGLVGPASLQLYSSTDGANFTPYGSVINPGAAFANYNPAFPGPSNASGLTYFRIYGWAAANSGANALLYVDNVTIGGCQTAPPPTISKTFVTNPVAVGGTSMLTFTVSNPGGTALTGVKFSDALPAGLQVAASPSAATTCAGSPSWSPGAGATTLDFGLIAGATLAGGASCTASVNVIATSAGPHTNVSGFVSSTEGGTNTGSTGSAVASLTAILPPTIDKAFDANPIVVGATSLLTFTIANPNPSDALAGVAFADTYPPGVINANPLVPAPTSTCGGTLTTVAGNNGASLVGGALAAGGNCTITVPVTAAAAGSYANTSGAVLASVAGSGNAASDTLVVVAPSPAIGLHKQVGTGAAGPWYNFVTVAPGTPIYYKFTAENTGDVTLATFGATDPALAGSPADPVNCTWASPNSPSTLPTLPVATATTDPTATCVVGPISAVLGDHVNTATAAGVYSGTSYTSGAANAEYLGAVPGFTLVKEIGIAAGGPWSSAITVAAGTGVYYRLTLANTGGVVLSGVNVTDPLVSTASCTFSDPLVVGAATFCVVGPVTATGTAGSTTTNTAVGHGSNGGTTYDTLPASASYTIPAPLADVSLVKTLTTAGPFAAGQSISYTLVVANAGPDPATGVQITDTPASLAITGVSGGGCAALPCTLASLAVGASATITVTATINAAGAFDNSATALAAESDPDLANNTDNSGNGGIAAASADVSLSKTLTTAGPFVAGQSVVYSIVVANAGPSTATNIQVTDTPTNLAIANVAGACAAVPCTIASLAAGANVTLTVTATIAASGSFDNSATALAAEFDPNPANNTDNSGNGGATTPAADVSLVKTPVTAGPYAVGQAIAYTLVVANGGPDAATNVQVTDTPSNLTIVNVSGGGCAALPCTIASLAPGASATINVTATINAAGAFDNTASANGAELDPNPANNTDSTGNGGVAGASADVSLAKTLITAGPYTAGQTLTYSIVVANAGPSTATVIQVTDTPTNLAIAGVAGACSALPCTIASLAPGASVTITVTATINSNGAFDNSATAVAAEPDPDLANNTDSAGNGGTAGAGADLAIAKSDGLAAVLAGGTTSYTLTVVNNGPSAVTGALLADPPAAGLAKTLVACSPTPGQCVIPPTVAELESGTFALPPLANGATYQLVISAVVTAVAGNVTNNATIAAPAGVTDPDNANNAASDVDAVVGGPTGTPTADLALAKSDGVGSVTAGGSTAYTIVVTNNGPDEVSNATVVDPATPGLLLGAWTCAVTTPGAGGSVTTACGSAAGSGPISTTVTMKSGATITFVVNASVTAAPGANVVNTASIAPPSGVIDPVPANNSATDTDTVVAAPVSADLAITKTDGVASVNAGGSTTYTITVTNNGPGEVTGATVVDNAPPGMAFGVWTCAVTSPGAGGSVVTACGAASGAGNVNTTVTMKNGAVVAFTVPATVAPTASGTLVNTATVAVPASVTDPTPANNSATDSDGVVVAPASADLVLTKTSAAASVSPGGSTTYTLTVTNNGPAEVAGATVVDNAPAGMTFGVWTCAVSNAGAGGSVTTACGAASGAGNVNATVTMKVGAVITFTVAATVAPGASGSLVNTATVTPPAGTNDPTPANNGASSTVTVTAAPAAVVNVPALETSMLAVLALLLAAVAMRALATQRRPLRRQ